MEKRLKFLATLSCVALVGAALVAVADAHIGVSHSPFTTDGPDLRSTSIDGEDVVFCFDEEVIGPVESAFGIRGYDSGTLAVADDVELDPDKNGCIRASFADKRALEEFTVGVALQSAVEDREGNESIIASAALGESEVEGAPGLTDAPNLTFNFKVDSIKFVLDEDMNCGAMGASAFGYYTDEGSSSTSYGTGIKDCDDDEAVIDFGSPVDDDLARVFIDPSNGGPPCAPAPSGACMGWEAEGDETDSPDLVDAERDHEDVTFSFDEDIDGAPDDSKFQVSTEDGTKETPTGGSCDIENNNRDVTCEFPAIEDAGSNEITLAGVGECAVMSDENTPECSTIGDASIETSGHAPGATDGPDLET
ncbi:MAG: hypothetical protein QOK47_236, partial [Actinomycetota bacterium]|nr:hypothetical protein [Actinomycetota bacterium]